MIFNIKYLENENTRDRLWHSGVGKDNFFGYLKRDNNTLSKNERQVFSPLFDLDGLLTNKELEKIRESTTDTKATIWSGFISFDTSEGIAIKSHKTAIYYINDVLVPFLEMTGFKRDNLTFVGTFHIDTDYPHIHFQFFEKEPSMIRYDRKYKILKEGYRGRFTKQELKRIHKLNKMHFSKNRYFYDTFRMDYNELLGRKVSKKDINLKINELVDLKRNNQTELFDMNLNVLCNMVISSNKTLKNESKNRNLRKELERVLRKNLLQLINLQMVEIGLERQYRSRYSEKIKARKRRKAREDGLKVAITETLRELSEKKARFISDELKEGKERASGLDDR